MSSAWLPQACKNTVLYNIYVTILRDAGWIGGLTKVTIYTMCANQH